MGGGRDDGAVSCCGCSEDKRKNHFWKEGELSENEVWKIWNMNLKSFKDS